MVKSPIVVSRYIDYNVKKLAKPGAISRHTDNDSMVTMVVPTAPVKPWIKKNPWAVENWEANILQKPFVLLGE